MASGKSESALDFRQTGIPFGVTSRVSCSAPTHTHWTQSHIELGWTKAERIIEIHHEIVHQTQTLSRIIVVQRPSRVPVPISAAFVHTQWWVHANGGPEMIERPENRENRRKITFPDIGQKISLISKMCTLISRIFFVSMDFLTDLQKCHFSIENPFLSGKCAHNSPWKVRKIFYRANLRCWDGFTVIWCAYCVGGVRWSYRARGGDIRWYCPVATWKRGQITSALADFRWKILSAPQKCQKGQKWSKIQKKIFLNIF